jgi:hypothetical protein
MILLAENSVVFTLLLENYLGGVLTPLKVFHIFTRYQDHPMWQQSSCTYEVTLSQGNTFLQAACLLHFLVNFLVVAKLGKAYPTSV